MLYDTIFGVCLFVLVTSAILLIFMLLFSTIEIIDRLPERNDLD